MIIGVGVDIVELARIDECLNEHFLARILTTKERALMKNYSHARQVEFVAGRFAAKEAIIKALSNHSAPTMRAIEILANEKGAPICHIKDVELFISIAHEKNTAIAYALAQEIHHDN